jgi:uncharacterized protein YjbI with pentapeptide repeats
MDVPSALPEHIKQLIPGVDSWNKWRSGDTNIRPVLCGYSFTDLDIRDLTGLNLSQADLRNCNFGDISFRGANFKNADLRGAEMLNANWEGAIFDYANMQGQTLVKMKFQNCSFENTNLTGACLKDSSFIRAKFPGAIFTDACLERADFRGSILQNSKLIRTNLKEAKLDPSPPDDSNPNFQITDLRSASLSEAQLHQCSLYKVNAWQVNFFAADLKGANLTEATLTNAKFEGTKIDYKTNLRNIRFSDHAAMDDFSEMIIPGRWDRYISWSKLSFIMRIPLFGVSWSILIGLVTGINVVTWINQRVEANQNIELLAISCLKSTPISEYIPHSIVLLRPIPIPHSIPMLLIGILFLAFGSAFYKFGCPDRIQEETETHWVESLNLPRLQYMEKNYSRRIYQGLTCLFFTIGASISIFLFAKKLLPALFYSIRTCWKIVLMLFQ